MTDPLEISDRAAATLNREFGALERQLRSDGRRDRAAMGNPDPTIADAVRNLTNQFKKLGELFGRAQ